MKNIYRLFLTSLFFTCTFLSKAQNIDTATLEKNEYGKVSYAHVINTKMADATNFLKINLKATTNDSFALTKESTDELGIKHLRYQQYYQGVKVENAEYMLHGKNGNIETMNGDFQVVNIASVSPTLSEAQALSNALKYVNAKEYIWQDSASENFIKQKNNASGTYYPKGELVIQRDYLKGGKNLLLSWKFSIFSLIPNNLQLIYVDAITGEIINSTPQMLDTNTPLTAQTKYSGTLAITGDSYTGGFRLREVRNGVSIQTLNLQNTYNYSSAIDFANANTNFTSGSWASFAQNQQALDAHWGAENVLDFWRVVFNRNSLDDNGIAIVGYVHAGSNWSNALWVSGVGNRFMQYGDGDGSTYNPLTALDVCAHEMGHGINEFTANLTPGSQESGALNEGFSDIWSSCIENWAAPNKQTWLLGEEIFKTTAYNCVRNLQNPKDTHAHEGQHPNTYHGQYWSASGEPHTNSTVLSHWFYLLSQGGSGTNDNSSSFSVTGIGIAKARQIAWRTEAVYLTFSSGYSNARTLSIQAATDLFCANSSEVKAVTDAWYAVGVGAAYSGNTMSVSGLPYICSSTNYTIANQPSGITSIAWLSSNTPIATINPSGQAAKVTDGMVNISATVTGSLGCVETVAVNNIVVGAGIGMNGTYNSPTSSSQQMNPTPPKTFPPILNAACVAFATNVTIPAGSTISWSGAPDAGVIWGVAGNTAWVNFSAVGQQAALSASISNSCGSYSKRFVFQCTTMNTCGIQPQFAPPDEDLITLSPNPASGTITITANDESSSAQGEPATAKSLAGGDVSSASIHGASALRKNTALIKQLKLYDASGRLVKQVNYATVQRQVKVNVAGLKPGVYFVEISNGKSIVKKKLVIQR